jgi:hypothetical protein
LQNIRRDGAIPFYPQSRPVGIGEMENLIL